MPGGQVPVTSQGGEGKPVSIKHSHAVVIPFFGALISLGFALTLPVDCGGGTSDVWLFIAVGLSALVFYAWFLISASRLVFDRLFTAIGAALAANFVLGVAAWIVSVIDRGGQDVAASAAFWIPCWPLALLVVRIADACPQD